MRIFFTSYYLDMTTKFSSLICVRDRSIKPKASKYIWPSTPNAGSKKKILIREIWLRNFRSDLSETRNGYLNAAASEMPSKTQARLARQVQHQCSFSRRHWMPVNPTLVPLLQSTAAYFCLPKASQPESSMPKKPEIALASKQFLFQINTEYDLHFYYLLLCPNFPEIKQPHLMFERIIS